PDGLNQLVFSKKGIQAGRSNPMANHLININPSQKFGIDSPNNARIIKVMYCHEYCLVADTTQALKPRNRLKHVLQMASSTVTQKRPPFSSVTARPLRMELPRSPTAALLI